MDYKVPFSMRTPIDPIVYQWIDTIPDKYQQAPDLMDFLLRLAPNIYHGGIVGEGVNPFYKIIEILNAPKLYYENLLKIHEYYDFYFISYLTQGNRGEYYTGYPCKNASSLKKALKERKNQTTKDTLSNILANII